MKKSSSSGDLKSLLEAIKSAEVVESRIQLLSDLQELDITEKSDVASLIGALTILWEDFTCLDISQCMLNKTILHVAAKYLESDISRCAGEFLSLGIKASLWSRKHLKMTVMSTNESPEEEHSGLFYQLLLDVLGYSAASFSALARNSISSGKELMLTIENFILEQLNLTKDSLSEIKRINPFGSEVQKVAQLVLDAVIRLCKVYSNGVNWDLYSARFEEDEKVRVNEVVGHADHVINIAKYTIDKLCEVGILAANDGGSLVSVLNLSWKGVVTVLQLGRGTLARKVNVAGVILNLISLANESLRHAAQTWSLGLKEGVSTAEAKRIFLPVKFYLINAVRIISQYTTEAVSICKEIAECIIVISTLRIYFSKEELLKAANEALVEVLEPTSFHLLNSIINCAEVKQEQKFQILDWLLGGEDSFSAMFGASSSKCDSNSIVAFLFISSDGITGVKMLLVGQVALIVNLFKSSSDLGDDIKLWMARKLSWLLEVLADEDVYSACLVLQVPMSHDSHHKERLACQPLFHSILNALKSFLIVMSSSPAWYEIENFLLENLFHPHILCSEIITELWSFILRHSESDAANDIVEKLCSLLKCTASPESLVSPGSALRQFARSICTLVSYGSEALADRVYSSVTGDNKSQHSSIIYTALLMEGFLLNSLPERTRIIAKERVITEYFAFVESFGNELATVCGFGIYGAPVFALSAALQSQQVTISDSEMKTVKLLHAIMQKYRESADKTVKNIYRSLLGEVLGIISNMKNLYSYDEMEGIILELRNLFITRSSSPASDSQLFPCKPNLASFMAGLGHVELSDSDDNPKISAVWELCHMLLREQHWAFAHLAITAFGYFAARTSCNELWRFVPHDAALSFDLDSGNEADEDRFMSELKAFLEKESASLVTKTTPDHLRMLIKEGRTLKEIVETKMNNKQGPVICNAMEIDEVSPVNKKRKLPDGISKGVELVQGGMKVMGDGLSQWQHNHFGFTEIHDKFLTHFSRLEDVVAHLVRLANSS